MARIGPRVRGSLRFGIVILCERRPCEKGQQKDRAAAGATEKAHDFPQVLFLMLRARSRFS